MLQIAEVKLRPENTFAMLTQSEAPVQLLSQRTEKAVRIWDRTFVTDDPPKLRVLQDIAQVSGHAVDKGG